MTIGVLAIQGDFAAHGTVLRRLGVDWREVRFARDLDAVDALIVPGGESTTMMSLLDERGLGDAIRAFAASGRAIMGTCAGAIVLARRVMNPEQASLGLVDMTVTRNAYGRQVDSFVATTGCEAFGGPELEMVFIRAPIIESVGPGVEVLAEFGGHPVLVRQDEQYLMATFHPELSDDARVHEHFLSFVGKDRGSCKVEALTL